MMAVGEGISARNADELNRQVTRQAMATLLRRGIRATVSSGIPLHPAASTLIRVTGQFLGEDVPALPAQTATSDLSTTPPARTGRPGKPENAAGDHRP